MINKEKLAAPKGTRDSIPGSLILKNKLIKIIERNFVLFGFDAWDGPTFENIEVLTAKSGDEIKGQIYNFVDKGGRELGLRFDLTTTLARIIASNPNLKKPIRCYNYGSAFRYENTQKGRYREFFQIDADVFGVDTVEAEMELMGIVSKTMLDLGISNAYIVINDRKILSAITEKCNIPQTKSATVLRCIDKLDKVGFENVRKELLDCGIPTTQIDSLFAILEINGTLKEKIDQFKEIFVDYPIILKSLSEIQEIADKCEIEVRFEPTLVRGQDYYTGMIYEYKIPNDLSIGSVGGGGRYDNYVETFGGAKTSAVGISFGVDRMIDIIEQDKALCAHILKSENKTKVEVLFYK